MLGFRPLSHPPSRILQDKRIELVKLADDRLPLDDLEFLPSLAQKLGDLLGVLHRHVLAEGVSRSALRVFSEVVGGELLPLTEELAVLFVIDAR